MPVARQGRCFAIMPEQLNEMNRCKTRNSWEPDSRSPGTLYVELAFRDGSTFPKSAFESGCLSITQR